MENTLKSSQRLVVYKLGYYFTEPRTGDIVVFQYKEGSASKIAWLRELPFFSRAITSYDEIDYIKRVIGLPGDKVDIKEDGFVYVNDIKIDEPYLKQEGETYSPFLDMPVIVPDDMVFAMGDNRMNSKDSRQIGFIPYEKIKGKVVLRIWPFDEFGVIR
jgi:signal peptidase I